MFIQLKFLEFITFTASFIVRVLVEIQRSPILSVLYNTIVPHLVYLSYLHRLFNRLASKQEI